MSNERIDLKQFEGIGEWKVLAHRHNKVIDWQVKTGRNMRSKEEAETIAKLPTLIAELKRGYEEINLVHRNLSIVRNALARGYPDIEEEIWKLIDASE
jgi:polyhydroxyalkanoate synthesis regulator phasin